jgi:hypothetical protein
MVFWTLLLWTAAALADSGAWLEVQGGSWNPSTALLSDVEAALRIAVPPAATGRGRLPDWRTYTFQYQGQSAASGHRYVRVNAFCWARDNFPDLTKEWVEVKDGGACFFSAKYDTAAKRLYDLQVNGVA